MSPPATVLVLLLCLWSFILRHMQLYVSVLKGFDDLATARRREIHGKCNCPPVHRRALTIAEKEASSLLALIRRVFNPPLALIRRFCGRYAFLGLYNYHVEKSCIKTGGKVKSFRRGLTW